MIELTPKQREILDYIKQFIDTHRFSPSYREIMHHFQYKSIGTVYNLLKTLKERGHLAPISGGRRALTIQSKVLNDSQTLIPLIGTLSGVNGITTFTHFDSLSVPISYIQDPLSTYLLRIEGNDFSEEGILNGDLLVVEGREMAKNGEIVIALLNQTVSLIRSYTKEEDLTLLKSRSGSDPIRLASHCVLIRGILKALIRQF